MTKLRMLWTFLMIFAPAIAQVDYIWMDGDVRLVEGSNNVDRYEGRLEIYHDNRWGTVCAKNTWGISEATVVCQQLGRDHVEVTRHFGPGRDVQDIFLNEVQCSGLESTLAECQSPGWGVYDDDCTHEDDIGVVCGSGEEYDDIRMRYACCRAFGC